MGTTTATPAGDELIRRACGCETRVGLDHTFADTGLDRDDLLGRTERYRSHFGVAVERA
jgi:hypothetical protein